LERPVLLEVGTEEQNGGLNTPEQLNAFLDQLRDFCAKRQYDMPVFVVAQTGTLVRETRNVGHFASSVDPDTLVTAANQVGKLVRTASSYGVWIKEHNADYLPDEFLHMRPAMGIGAVNIAPELGVTETRFWLQICESLDLRSEAEAFLQLAFETGKWEKWLLPRSTATDRDKGIIAGHYVFGTTEFREVFARIQAASHLRGFDLQRAIREHLKAVILRLAIQLRICSS